MTTRRTVLAAAAGAAGLGVPLFGAAGTATAADNTASTGGAPSTSAAGTAGAGAGAAQRSVPGTLVRRIGPRGRAIAMPETSFPLSHLAVSWTAPAAPAVRLRFRSGWGGWLRPAPCDGRKDGPAPTRRHALLSVPAAVGYEIAAGSASAAVSVTELNTVDGPARTVAAAPTVFPVGYAPAIRYLCRAAWGADESWRFNPDGTENWPAEYIPVQTLTVHHTAGANDDPDPAATVRAIYYYDAVTQGWGDMGYHLLIDEAGTVYEGRWSGSDRVPVFGGAADANGRPQMVNGAHVGGFNAGNVGVVLLGDFSTRQPTQAARRSLTFVLAALAKATGLDPLGTTNYVNPISGATRKVSTISGHRDWAATLCPGDTYYRMLDDLRSDVHSVMRI